jgi:hypothetical protein
VILCSARIGHKRKYAVIATSGGLVKGESDDKDAGVGDWLEPNLVDFSTMPDMNAEKVGLGWKRTKQSLPLWGTSRTLPD